jgi:hypothetical protein
MTLNNKFLIILFSLSLVFVPFFDLVQVFGHGLSLFNLFIFSFGLIAIIFYYRYFTISIYLIFLNLFFIFIIQLTLSNYSASLKPTIYPILIILSLCPLIKNYEDLKFLILSITTFIVISCLIAIMQFFLIDFAWNLREFFGYADDDYIKRLLDSKMIPMGMSFYSVQLGYQITMAVPLLYSIKNQYNLKIVLAFLIIIITTAILIKSNSTILCIFLFFLYEIFTKKISYDFFRSKYFLIILSVPIFIFVFIDIYYSKYYFDIFELNLFDKLSRIPLTIAAIISIFENPFGVNDFNNALKEVYLSYFHFFQHLPSHHYIDYGYSSHNAFLNYGMKFGIIPLIFYLVLISQIFYHSIFFNKKNQYSPNSNFTKFNEYISISIILLILKSFFHNAGLTSADIFTWTLVGTFLMIHNNLNINDSNKT